MDKTAKEFIIDSLDRIYSGYKSRLSECVGEFSEKQVHDLRVTIRRFLSLLLVLSQIIQDDNINHLIKSLKKQLKFLNPLRDTQVLLLTVHEKLYKFPVLYSFNQYLSVEEASLIIKAQMKLKTVDIEDIEGFAFFLKLSLRNNLTKNCCDYQLLYKLAGDSYAIVIDASTRMKPDDLDTIHQLRLAFKKFRYIMEFLQVQLKLTKDDLKKMRGFQTILGNIQDNRVFYNKLELFVRSKTDSVFYELHTPTLNSIIENRKVLINSLFENLSILSEFWLPPMK